MFEYELTLNFEIVNDAHLAKASKDRTGLFMNEPEQIITSETGRALLEWANSGIDTTKEVINLLQGCSSREELNEVVNNNPITVRIPEVTEVLQTMGKKYPKS